MNAPVAYPLTRHRLYMKNLASFLSGIRIIHPSLWSVLCKNSNLPLGNVNKKYPR